MAYLLYNIIFKFVIPVYRTTKRVRRSFKDMQERMQQHTQKQNGYATDTKAGEPKGKMGEYIEFEEVKE